MVTLLTPWLLGAALATELPDCRTAERGERTTVHLLSIAPGGGLFDSMGHTALLFSGGDLDRPRLYNWGVFDSTQPNLLPTFLKGELQYYLMAFWWEPVRDAYVAADRSMVGQRLDLDEIRARALYDRVDTIARSPELRPYTYHWALANCSTKARDALDEATDGALRAALDRPVPGTPRTEALRHLRRHPVSGFAWDFVTSTRLDQPMTAWDRAMLPEHLMHDLESVPGPAGRPLVAETCDFYRGGFDWVPAEPPAQWPWAIPGLVGSAAVLTSATRPTPRARRLTGALLATCGAVFGLLGTTSLVLWKASSLEGVGPTTNWLLAGPQSLVFAWAGATLWRGRVLEPMQRWGAWANAALGVAALPFVTHALPALLPAVLACAWVVHRERTEVPRARGTSAG